MKLKLSSTTQNLAGMGLGVAAGLFFGERCSSLSFIGGLFVKLMQMTILPYVIVSLISGIGRLDGATARTLVPKAVALIVAFYAAATALVICLPWSFPATQNAFFYGSISDKAAVKSDIVALFVPSNLFQSLASNTVPAVVFFCICFGVGLIGARQKEVLLHSLDILSQALSNITRTSMKIAPLGIFALTANSAGTITFDQLGQVQVYLVTCILGYLLLSFWVMPAIVACLSPLRQRDVLGASRNAMILGFSTGSAFLALPLLVEAVNALHTKHDPERTADDDKLGETILPVMFIFPAVGDVLVLFFIVFVSWCYKIALHGAQYAKLFLVGTVTLFSGSINTVQFLLKDFHLPDDAFDLFMVANVITRNFSVLSGVMGMFTLTLLTVFWLKGLLKVQWKRLVPLGIATVVLVAVTLVASRNVLAVATKGQYQGDRVVLGFRIKDPTPAVVHTEPQPALAPTKGVLAKVARTKVLKVGYIGESMPWSYVNDRHELVGYDVEMAHRLAKSLDSTLEFVPMTMPDFDKELNRGDYDIAMLAISISPGRIAKMDFSAPHRTLPSVFVVKDFRKDEFQDRASIARIPNLRLAVLDKTLRFEKAGKEFPNATIVPVTHLADFFERNLGDALYIEAGKGYSYTLLYPEFCAVTDGEGIPDLSAYAVAKGESDWLAWVNAFLGMQKNGGTEKLMFEHWVLGKFPSSLGPRWNVATNVLHWKL